MVGGHRDSAVRLDDRAEQVVRRPPRRERSPYDGIATRTLALATDVAHHRRHLHVRRRHRRTRGEHCRRSPSGVAGGRSARLGLAARGGGLLRLFWSTAGQTPGMRLLHVRVGGPGGDAPSVGRSLVRFVGLVLAIVPLFTGFLPVLFTERSTRPPGLPRRHRRHLRLAPSRNMLVTLTGRASAVWWIRRARNNGARGHLANARMRLLRLLLPTTPGRGVGRRPPGTTQTDSPSRASRSTARRAPQPRSATDRTSRPAMCASSSVHRVPERAGLARQPAARQTLNGRPPAEVVHLDFTRSV